MQQTVKYKEVQVEEEHLKEKEDEVEKTEEDDEENEGGENHSAAVFKKEKLLYIHDPSIQIKMGIVSTGFFLFFVVFSLLIAFYERGGDD